MLTENHRTSKAPPRGKKTIENLGRRTCGDYSSNIKRGIQDTTLGRQTIN